MDEGGKKTDKPGKNRPPGLMSKVKDSLLQLSVKKKEIDDKYDQSIAALREWETNQNKKLDAVEEQLKLRYNGTVIDVALHEQQAEMERRRQRMRERNIRTWEEHEALAKEFEEYLKGNKK